MRSAIFAYFDNGGEGLGLLAVRPSNSCKNRPQKSDPPANVGIAFVLGRHTYRHDATSDADPSRPRRSFDGAKPKKNGPSLTVAMIVDAKDCCRMQGGLFVETAQ